MSNDNTKLEIIYSLDTKIAKETRRCIQNIEDIVLELSDQEKSVLSDYYLSIDRQHPLTDMRKDIWFNLVDSHDRIKDRIRDRLEGQEDSPLPSVGDLMDDADEID